jgi:hypothetical protein
VRIVELVDVGGEPATPPFVASLQDRDQQFLFARVELIDPLE